MTAVCDDDDETSSISSAPVCLACGLFEDTVLCSNVIYRRKR
jgi:hypothetical protein